MRYLSQYPNYGIQIRPQRVEPLGDGTSRVVAEPLYIHFTPVDSGAMLYDKERLLASEHFEFHGRKQHSDEATPVDIVHRLSVFDTDEQEWDFQTKAEVEDILDRKALTTPNAILKIVGRPVEPPFPAYDLYVGDPEQLVLMLNEMGFNLEEIKFYEESYGPKRPEVIEALDIAIGALRELTVQA